MPRLLLLSNGHGEDAIAATLGRALVRRRFAVEALPLVGRGEAYARAGFPPLGPCDEQPSGGLLMQNPRLFVADLRGGWLRSWLLRWRSLRAAVATVDAAVAVGDVVPLASLARFPQLRRFYLPTAVTLLSNPPDRPIWPPPFGRLERRWMRSSLAVFPRDAATSAWLQRAGVTNVSFYGNVMLDAVAGEATIADPPPYLLLLPGTRSDVALNLRVMLEAARRLRDGPRAWVAWGLADPVPAIAGWELRPLGATGAVAAYHHPDGTLVGVARGAFATLLRGARVAIATTGTAAEQCVGYGVPVVAFATPGSLYATFAQRQQRMLGDALERASDDPEALAAAVRRADADPQRRAAALVVGRELMGEAGGSERIAAAIARHLRAYNSGAGVEPSTPDVGGSTPTMLEEG
jgi:uncharacterized protein (TIGR03492 family)